MNQKTAKANRITQARKAMGITIKELSARIKTLSAGRISNWEQGTRSPGSEEAMLLSKQLNVAGSWLLCMTNNPQGEFLDNSKQGFRYIPVLSMQDAPHAQEISDSDNVQSNSMIVVENSNPSIKSKTLFAVKVEDNSMHPDFNPGDVVVIDGEKTPNPGDYVIVYLSEKKRSVIRKYREADGYLFQLLASNELWAPVNIKQLGEAEIIGVIVELRKVFN